jgi:Peptide methionine sulfoxide reductase
MRPFATTEITLKRSKSPSIQRKSATARCSSFSFTSMTRQLATVRATTSARATARRIFFTNEEQQRVALDTIADVEASGLWPGKVVTGITPAGPFWEAELEHQDDLERYPNGDACHLARPNWVLPRRVAATE